MATSSSADYCRELLRREDRDRYVASLFAPDDVRPELWGLYSFSHEIARIRNLVSGPAAGELRLGWWSDAIEAIFAGRAIDHPVARTLARACIARDLPRQAFIDLIEARRFDLYGDPMPSLGDLEGYLGETSSAVFQLAAMILDRANAGQAAATAGFAGVAYGLVSVLRSLPLHRARGQCFIPIDVLARHGLEPKHVLSGERGPGMGTVLEELRALAMQRLGEARGLGRRLSPKALPAFLPLALVEAYAARLARSDTRALDGAIDVPHLVCLLRVWRAARRGYF